MDEGIVRCIDENGRYVIAKEYRKALGIKEGDPLIQRIVNGEVVITSMRLKCAGCGLDDETKLSKVMVRPGCDIVLCPDCAARITNYWHNKTAR